MRIEAVIDEVITQENSGDCLQPIIVNFQNGQLKDEETNNMKSGIFHDEKQGKTVLALSNGNIVYRGYRPNLNLEPMCTMLVIHNKKSGKIKLVQAERWDVAPVLDRNLNAHQDVGVDKLAALNKQFGSKKVKRRTELHEKMKISGESVKELLEKTVSNVEIEKRDSLDTEEPSLDSILPPCNRDAARVEDVYNINDIVPREILKTLYDVDIEKLKNDIDIKSKFFIQTFEYIRMHGNPSKRMAVLLYIDAVLSWMKLPIKAVKKHGAEVCHSSMDVNEYIIEKYSVNAVSGRLRPSSIKDKGIVHCMILALAICDYTLDLELFATEIGGRISIKKLTDFAKMICAVPLKENKKKVVLKLPLPPQISSFAKRKIRK